MKGALPIWPQYGAHPPAASWDDWGRFFAAVFAIDPSARCGPYNGREDFHTKTDGKYNGEAI
jgi:hypothetical protein